MLFNRLSFLIFFLLGILGIQGQDSPAYSNFNDQLAQGWNTWNYESMLSHVLLPQGLAFNINFRPSVLGTPYDTNYHYNKITVDKTGRVRPQAHTFDGSYTDVIIDGWKGNTIRVQSAQINENIVVLVEPITSSSTTYFVELQAGFLWNHTGHIQKEKDQLLAITAKDTISINTTGSIAENARPYMASYLSINSNIPFGVYTGPSQTLTQIQKAIQVAKEAYEAKAEAYGELAEGYKAAQSVLGWNTLYDADLNRVVSPVTRGWNEAWQGFVLFEWDTYFAALLLGLDHKEYAYSNAMAVSKGVNRYGAVAFTQQPRNQLADNSQPPVGSMVCWKLYEKYQETWFLEEVFDGLLSWNRWWVNNRRNQGYLTWGASWPNANVQDGRWESGLDNSPMYEEVEMQTVGNNSLFNLADVGLNSLYVMDCQYLQKIAQALGKKEIVKELRDREKEYTKKVQSLWSEEHGIFLNKWLQSNTFSNSISPTLLYPLIAGIPTQKQAQTILKKHYFNPDEFYGTYMIPSIARNDAAYNNDYWRGAIWGPMNFLVYLGLKNYDDKAAKQLASQSYELFEEAWLKHRYVFENINAEKGVVASDDQLNCDPYYHWGALMGLMQFMELGHY
ncbi:MAG: trehalase family glycosidase [Bacteroidota bacterium]